MAAARGLFAERGFARVGTEEIVRAAGVTRGALYHQFADKRELFAAVVEEVEAELVQQAASRMEGHTDLLAAFRAACLGWLEACAAPEAQRIVLLDAPSVLGREAWREIAERHGLGVVAAALRAGMDAGVLAHQPVDALAHVLVGALDEAAVYVAQADDHDAAMADMRTVLERLVDSLRATPAG